MACACSNRNKFQLIISNSSPNRPTVDMTVSLNKQVIFQKVIKWSHVASDLQYVVDTTLADGEYLLSINADEGQAQANQRITVEGDRWVFITYNFENDFFHGFKDSVLNTTTGKKEWVEYRHSVKDTEYDTIPGKKGYVRLNPTVSIHIMDEQPRHH